ncbi:MAG: hypothetical protein Q9N26_05500 [Aquificota bacterium]|nr:hypothetical protein [Aquificota bacterium]
MGRVVRFPGGDEERRSENPRPLTEDEIRALLDPLREGLKRLYPTQVKEVLGLVGVGERTGEEVFLAGYLIWEGYRTGGPVVSTFLSVFIKNRLEKISFREARRNYWDWNLMVNTYRGRFNVEEMLRTLDSIKERMGWGSG